MARAPWCAAWARTPRKKTALVEGWQADRAGAGYGGPFDVQAAQRITGEVFYAGHVFVDRDGEAALLAFRNIVGRDFVGQLIDPITVQHFADNLYRAQPSGLGAGLAALHVSR